MNRVMSFATAFALVLVAAGCDGGVIPGPDPINLGPGANAPNGPAGAGNPGPGGGLGMGGAPGAAVDAGQGGTGAPGGEGVPGAGAPAVGQRTLAFRMPPLDAVMKAPFELLVEVRDPMGQVDAADSATVVTLRRASGGGQLDGDAHPYRGRRGGPLRGPGIRPVGEPDD